MATEKKHGTPALEWIAAAVGLILLISVAGIIGREAIMGNGEEPPSIEIRLGKATRNATGFLVPFEASSSTSSAAASVQVEATIREGAREIERSRATIDYVAGHGRASGGLIFRHDPGAYEVEARAIGFEDP